MSDHEIASITTDPDLPLPIIKDLNSDNWNIEIHVNGLYRIIAVHVSIVSSCRKMMELESKLNSVYKREGFAIYPIVEDDCEQSYVMYDYPNKLVLCVIVGHWG